MYDAYSGPVGIDGYLQAVFPIPWRRVDRGIGAAVARMETSLKVR